MRALFAFVFLPGPPVIETIGPRVSTVKDRLATGPVLPAPVGVPDGKRMRAVGESGVALWRGAGLENAARIELALGDRQGLRGSEGEGRAGRGDVTCGP